MFRQWIWVGVLVLLIGPPLWAQNQDRAIKRKREQRVALVIGNSQYEHIDTLRNPVNDAQGMARVLRNIGFEVIELFNGNREDMRRAINDFENRIHSNVEVALFYFAGHGQQARDEDYSKNYLVPIDANMIRETEVPDACISANWVLRIMQQREGTRVNLIILDACRNNPFESRSFRSTGRQGVVGLANMSAPSGSVIAYAAAPGQVAWDGDGEHSPYTGSLIKHINTPATIFDVFTKVAKDVRSATQHLNPAKPQEPWFSSNLTEPFSLFKTTENIPHRPIPPSPSREPSTLSLQERAYRKGIIALSQKHYESALEILTQPAEQGYVPAQYQIGKMYYEGGPSILVLKSGIPIELFVSPDYTLAWFWFNKVANGNNREYAPQAQFYLGKMCYEAQGKPKDLIQAHKWFNLAMAGGIEKARSYLEEVEREMTGSQIAEAQRLAREFKKR